MKTAGKGARAFFMMLMAGSMLFMFPSTNINKGLQAQTVPVSRLVTLCHFGRTIKVDALSVKYHLAHGDYLGVCNPNPPIQN